jgi:hypothetical protein
MQRRQAEEAARKAAEAERRRQQLAQFEAASNAALMASDGLCVVCAVPDVQAYLRPGVHWEYATGADFTVLCAGCRSALAPRAKLRENPFSGSG